MRIEVGMVLRVCANPDACCLPCNVLQVGEQVEPEFVSGASASPIGPTILLNRKRKERWRDGGSIGRSGDGYGNVHASHTRVKGGKEKRQEDGSGPDHGGREGQGE